MYVFEKGNANMYQIVFFLEINLKSIFPASKSLGNYMLHIFNKGNYSGVTEIM